MEQGDQQEAAASLTVAGKLKKKKQVSQLYDRNLVQKYLFSEVCIHYSVQTEVCLQYYVPRRSFKKHQAT